VSWSRLPASLAVATVHHFEPFQMLSNLGTSGKLNLSRALPKPAQIFRSSRFKICAEMHLQETQMSRFSSNCLKIQLTVEANLTLSAP
jgi:hypothetical protein